MNAKTIPLTLVLTVSVLVAVHPTEAQETAQTDYDVPSHFEVGSIDGKSSVTGQCRLRGADAITCNLITVEFLRPGEGDLQTAREKISKNPGKEKEEYQKFITEDFKKFLCSSDGKQLITKNLTVTTGQKARKAWQQILDSCSAKNPRAFFDSLLSLNNRICGLFVGSYSLDFKKVGKGQWISNPGPQGMCNTVTTYVLKRHESVSDAGLLWTLTETTVARDTEPPFCSTDLGKPLNKPLVWSWDNPKTFELPSCEFIGVTHVEPDMPSVR